MTNAAQRVLRLAAWDRLLVAIEAICANPGALLVMLDQGFTMFGLNLAAILQLIRSPVNSDFWRALFALWGIFNYSRVGFDIAGTASGALSPHMMDEYRWDAACQSFVISKSQV